MTTYVRNRLAIALAAALLTAPAGPSAWSQATGTIKIVVPYTPGSGPDILSRLMAEQIGRAQGPTVVVENRPGGGTVIGTEAVERAEPDGRTVLLVANSFVINPPLQRASYDPTTSFEPVCYLAATPMVLVVLGSSPYRTLNDLIAAARAKPGELAFASGGPGSSLHIAIEVLNRAANINITYVPYGGTAPAINALMGNHVAAVWADYPTVVSQLNSRCAGSSPPRTRGSRRCRMCRRWAKPASANTRRRSFTASWRRRRRRPTRSTGYPAGSAAR